MSMIDNLNVPRPLEVDGTIYEYIVTKDDDGDYVADVVNFHDLSLSWRVGEDIEGHEAMCEGALIYGIRDTLARKEDSNHK